MDQAASDRLYELAHGPRWRTLEGKTAAEVVALLGPPGEVLTLDHGGHTWKQAVYRFAALPSQANEEERAAAARGMEFTPTVFFRDGVAVSPERFAEEVLGGPGVAAPGDPGWRPGELP